MLQFASADGGHCEAVTILDVDVLSIAPITPSPPKHEHEQHEPGMPLADITDMADCTCFVPDDVSSTDGMDSDRDRELEESESSDRDDDKTDDDGVNDDVNDDGVNDDANDDGVDDSVDACEFIITLNVKGAAFDRFQPALQKVQTAISKQQEIKLKLITEPDNPVDKNAIAIKACLDDKWQALGYIGVTHLPRVHAGLKEVGEVTTNIHWVRRKFTKVTNHSYYTASIVLKKPTPWGSLRLGQKYNSKI